VIKLNGSPIEWFSKRQATVSASATEAEYIAITEAGRDLMWLPELLDTVGCRQPVTTLGCDTQVAITLTQKPSSHPRRKHIAIRHHQIREREEQARYDPTRLCRYEVPQGGYPHQVVTGTAHTACVLGMGLERTRKGKESSLGLFLAMKGESSASSSKRRGEMATRREGESRPRISEEA
jgi:hypothetical protein